MPLATTRMSGTTPKCPLVQKCSPVRPNPLCTWRAAAQLQHKGSQLQPGASWRRASCRGRRTSSAIIRMLFSEQISRTPRTKLFGGSRYPPSPWFPEGDARSVSSATAAAVTLALRTYHQRLDEHGSRVRRRCLLLEREAQLIQAPLAALLCVCHTPRNVSVPRRDATWSSMLPPRYLGRREGHAQRTGTARSSRRS